ncbi:MAG: AsmA-like C-terminal region-containing protein, partial [Hyphomicrobiaceae bacterium]
PKLPLRLTVRSAVLEATLDGLFRSGASPSFAGQAQFRLQSLRSFASWIGLGRGFGEQLRSLVVTGPLEWSLSQMSFARTTVDVDGNQASGALSIRHAGERLAIDATLGFKELDFADSLFAARPAASVALPPDTPHVLSLIDADLRLSADKLRAPALELGKAAVSIALRNGRLQADIAELDIEGGAAGGQLAVDLGKPEPVVDVRIKLKGVDAGRLLAAPLKRNPLLGRANVTFEGSTNGRSIRDAFTGLAGRGSFELTEPSRLGLDLQALVHAARASPVVGWSAAGKGSTPLESLNGRFRVIAGAVAIEVMQARTGASVMVGSGRLDIPARLMDLSIATGPAGAGETSVPAQSVLLMRGTWDTPAISLMPAPRPELKVEAPVRTH